MSQQMSEATCSLRRLQTRSSPGCTAAETAVTATGDKEPSTQSGEVTYATKGLQTSIQGMKGNTYLARMKEYKTQEKYHTLLSLAESP